ncbi:MAG: haloacid dehalogenase-like hydrolase [Eggerthellaceae bacterium]|nr:haloacid dehalogenase-like hydrolase [Eggerthellaceae bacterium]
MSSKNTNKQVKPVKEITKVAVFDFDGTCISGNAPALLVWQLQDAGLTSRWQILRLATWGICYKMHLHVSYSWAIKVTFESFDGWPREHVDSFMKEFYDSRIFCRIRKRAVQEIKNSKDAGYYTILLSATVSMIPELAAKDLTFDHCIATRIKKLDNGTYSKFCDDKAVEGEQKVLKVREFCDTKFGKGNWRLVSAYADHFTDFDILELAEEPFAVNPTSRLKKIAKRKGWPILDWHGGEIKGNGKQTG